jgi:hypothetical protein
MWQEPLVAAERLLEFEGRRPGSADATLALLTAEYGTAVSEGGWQATAVTVGTTSAGVLG